MANTLKLKQSAVAAKVPTTAQLQLGELAINTYDGRLFTKKNVSGTESIIEFVSNSGTWGISITGNAATVGGKAIGTSGNTIPLLDAANTWSQPQIFSAGLKPGPTLWPTYSTNIDFGADGAGVWRKIVTVACVNGTYSTVAFKIDVVDANTNHGTDGSVSPDIETYFVACQRTLATVLDTPDLCLVRGPSNRVRAVKTATGQYEIQIQPDAQYREYLVSFCVTTANQAHTITYHNGSAVGSTGTAQYNASIGDSVIHVETLRAWKGITCNATTLCTNLNADLLDGYHVGTSGSVIPRLDTANTWSNSQYFSVSGSQLLLHPAATAPTVIFRNDGSTFFLLLSDAGASPSGTWNALRPFSVNLTTGAVTIANGLTATLTGNASTATTLQTARAINGTSFNGSANITTATWGTARTLTIGNTGKSVDGSAAITWSLSEIGALPVAGGTLTGALTINLGTVGTGLALSNCDIVVTGGSVSANYISADAVVINYDPVQPTDATSKAYVDAMAAKDACLVATFNPIPYGVFDSITGIIAITYTPFTFTSVSSNTITLTGHQFNTGDCIRLDPSVQDASNYLTVNGTARAPGNTGNWYVVKVDANSIMVSNTLGNAMSGSSVSITITGAVTVTVKIPAAIDGQALSVGSRVLVRSQTSGAANGIYEVAGNTINAWSMYRSPDADTWGALSGALVPVPGGTVNNDSLWICTNGSTGTLNTTAVTFRALATASVTYGRSYSTEPSISTTGHIAASRFIRDQGAPATQNTAATLTSTQVGAGILQTTPTAPITLTLPTGTTMEEIVIGTGEAYDLSVINTSANAVTIAANTGHTIVGNATIAANTSSLWCFRKTGANTFVAYRIS